MVEVPIVAICESCGRGTSVGMVRADDDSAIQAIAADAARWTETGFDFICKNCGNRTTGSVAMPVGTCLIS